MDAQAQQVVQSGLEWVAILPYIFGFMALAIAGWVAQSISRMSDAIEKMKDSVASLNTNVAVVVVDQENLKRRVDKLEEAV